MELLAKRMQGKGDLVEELKNVPMEQDDHLEQ